MPRPAPRPAPAECPVCGTDVPPRASCCPHCGADERTGWNEDETLYDGLDLPDSAFDDDDQPAKRRPPPRRTATGIHPGWWLVAVGLLILFVGYIVLPIILK